MGRGRRQPAGTPDPLFARVFMTAASVNALPVTLGGTTMKIVVLAGLRFVFINRIRLAQNAARALRAVDLDRFQTLASASGAAGTPRDSSAVP